jgi:hypothetical protein
MPTQTCRASEIARNAKGFRLGSCDDLHATLGARAGPRTLTHSGSPCLRHRLWCIAHHPFR